MPTLALLLVVFADLAAPGTQLPGWNGHTRAGQPLPFTSVLHQPHFLVEEGAWVVYIGLPISQPSPIFRMARSRDGGRTWKQEDFAYDWHPKEVTLKNGWLAIDFIEYDCSSEMARYLTGRVGGKLREPKPILW